MKDLKNKKLALFFTVGISLETWQKIGNLDREIRPYNLLAKDFEKVYFITYRGKEELEFKKVLTGNIEILPKKFPFLPSLVYAFLIPLIYQKELKEVDVYKTNQITASPPAVLAKWFYKKKLVVRCGYEWLKFSEKRNKPLWKIKLIYLTEKIAYKSADEIILTSKEDKEFVEKRFKIPSSKIEVIPNYIDVDLFKPLDIPKEKNRIIFIGRLEEQKNLFNLIEAITNLPAKLVLVGSGSLKEKLKKFSKEKKANVEFKKNIANEKLPEELNKSEIFILPSLYEGCPKTLLEAMACGLSCIGTNVEGIKEILKHKENGYLCKTDVNSIKKAISEVLNDKALQQEISQNAKQTILENFNLEKVIKKELDVYKEIIT